MHVEVAVPVPGLSPLTYQTTIAGGIEPGSRVVVPLGSRTLVGVVVSTGSALPAKVRKIKNVVKVIDSRPVLNMELMKLGQWLAEYYQCSLGEAYAAMLPPLCSPPRVTMYAWQGMVQSEAVLTTWGERIRDRLQSQPLSRQELLTGWPKAALAELRRLQRQGSVQKTFQPGMDRIQTVTDENWQPVVPPYALNPEQLQAVAAIKAAMEQAAFKTMLLHGVTGSGKTEVYLQAIAFALQSGHGAILLVPEIALTSHLHDRIAHRFGSLLEVWHSNLTPKKRWQAWQRIQQGAARVVLGARSAVFAPVKDLGLVVVDEEYETSFKQDDIPRYHARDLAAVRCRQSKAVLVLGSATPSIESYTHAQQGRYTLLSLPHRVDNKQLPKIEVVDLGEEHREHGSAVFSQRLLAAIDGTLRRGEQSILFLNRRGFAPMVMCPACRHVLACTDCSISLVYHRSDDRLHCHGCGRIYPSRPACPKCGTACIRLVGAGTQRIEEEISRFFPTARILRLDQDVSRRRGQMAAVLQKFSDRQADILVGTQMVAKGLDFSGVTLVGIIAADMALHLPDFRAEERTFQLLLQVAGRAGRGDVPGLVIIQTYDPGHPIIKFAQEQDYPAFYRRELENRRESEYPPFTRLALISYRSSDVQKAQRASETAAEWLRRKYRHPRGSVLGPAAAWHERVSGESIYHLLLKSSTHSVRAEMIKTLLAAPVMPGVRRMIDVDPYRMF